jgi:hypothetical protein
MDAVHGRRAPVYREEFAILLQELDEALLEDVKNEGELIDYRIRESEL